MQKKKFVFHNSENYTKFCDNCHHQGKYRGASHVLCSSGHKSLKRILAVLHNRLNLWLSFPHKRAWRRGDFSS